MLLHGLLWLRLKLSPLPSPQGLARTAGQGSPWAVRLCVPAPGCWQGAEASPWRVGSCGPAMGDRRAPSREGPKCCRGSLPGPGATYPQLSHVPCASPAAVSRTRRPSQFMAARGTCQLQALRDPCSSTATAAVPAAAALPVVPSALGLMSQRGGFRVLGSAACGRGAHWGRGNIESRSHRMVWGGRDLGDHRGLTPLPWAGRDSLH